MTVASMTSKPAAASDYMTVREVAELIRKTEKTVRNWIKSKKLAAYDLGGSYLIHRRDLELFLRDRRTGGSTMSNKVQ